MLPDARAFRSAAVRPAFACAAGRFRRDYERPTRDDNNSTKIARPVGPNSPRTTKASEGRRPMSMLAALAISIGVLAVVATWLFLGPLASLDAQVWQAFIAWACFYHSGGKVAGARTAAVGMSFGAVIGMAAVLLAAQLGVLGSLAAPIAVGIGAAVIVLSSQVSVLSVIPASVYGFAAIAGLILLGPEMTAVKALWPTVLSILLGTAFGYVSEVL